MRPIFALLLLAAPAFGQAPSAVVKVDPPGPVKPGTFVTIDASGSVGQYVDFDTDVPDDYFRPDSNGKKLYFNASVGGAYPFKFESLSVIDGVIRKSKQKVVIAVEGAAPTPPPSPPPNPPDDGVNPTPTPEPSPGPVAPVTGKMYATLIYSAADPHDPVKGAVAVRQAGLLTTLALDDCKWSSYPDSAVRVDSKGTVSPTTIVAEQNYQPAIDAAGGLPAVIFQDQTGKILAAIRAGEPAEIVAKVKAFRVGGAR